MIGTPKQIIDFLYDKEKEELFEIKKYKGQRNKDQNKKYWKLLNQLSIKTKIGIEQLHLEMLKNYSQRYEILVPEEEQLRGIEYYDKKSKIIKNGNEYRVYHVYTPSHELTTEEFAILLEGLCNECKEQGIETKSPDELLAMEHSQKC